MVHLRLIQEVLDEVPEGIKYPGHIDHVTLAQTLGVVGDAQVESGLDQGTTVRTKMS